MAFGQTIIKGDSSPSFCSLEIEKILYNVNFYKTAKGPEAEICVEDKRAVTTKSNMANLSYTLVLIKIKSKLKL